MRLLTVLVFIIAMMSACGASYLNVTYMKTQDGMDCAVYEHSQVGVIAMSCDWKTRKKE